MTPEQITEVFAETLADVLDNALVKKKSVKNSSGKKISLPVVAEEKKTDDSLMC